MNDKVLESFIQYCDEMKVTTDFIALEIKSNLDDEFKSKEKFNLSSFNKLKLSKKVINTHKISFKALKHIRETCDGYLYLDNENECVAVVSIENKGDYNFIQGIEINKKYQGRGLSKQLLDIAVKEFNATKLSVNKKNLLAIDIYKKYGFKTYTETDNMLFMSINSAIDRTNTLNTNDLKLYKSDDSCSFKDKNGKVISNVSYYDFNMKNFDWILIANVKTKPYYRGNGLATKLMNIAENDIKKKYPNKGLYLFVKSNNNTAINLYKKLGFKIIKKYKLKDKLYDIMCKGSADISQFNKMKFN